MDTFRLNHSYFSRFGVFVIGKYLCLHLCNPIYNPKKDLFIGLCSTLFFFIRESTQLFYSELKQC